MIDRTCVVTGAGQGIGRAIARHFAERGARVVVAEINVDAGLETVEMIAGAGHRAIAIETDVTQPQSVADLAKRTEQAFGPAQILINNARWSGLTPTPAYEISDQDWRRALDVSVTGAFNCVRAFAPTMIGEGWGRIVNMSSATVRRPPVQPYAHYITAKAALVGLTRALAREFGQHGVTVNALLPGSIETEVQRSLTSAEREKRAKAGQSIPKVITAADVAGGLFSRF